MRDSKEFSACPNSCHSVTACAGRGCNRPSVFFLLCSMQLLAAQCLPELELQHGSMRGAVWNEPTKAFSAYPWTRL